MNTLKLLFIALILCVSVAGTLGCKEKGPAEKAGEAMDKAAEDATKAAKDLLGK